MWPIFFVRLHLSKSPHSIWGSVAPLPWKVLSAQDLVPPRGDYLNYRWKKIQLGGCKVKRPAPIYAGVRRYKVLSAQDLTGDGVGSPPPVQGGKLKIFRMGFTANSFGFLFSSRLVPRTHLKLRGHLRANRISSQHSFPQNPRFAQWAITTAKANQM